jgi:endonuclease/exonuclease/phosphatase family metal-dependent hydrolase
MKTCKIFFLLSLLAGTLNLAYSQEYKIMTYNLRYENTTDGENVWPNRRDFVLNQINYFEPDLIGTQEGVTSQLAWLDENLADYSYTGVAREGEGKGEYSAIFYNNKKFKIIEKGDFWLSETPEKVSKGWDAAQHRICSYALFEDIKEGTRFYMFNTHFDHKGNIAREKSAELIIEKIKTINSSNLPYIFSGDLNITPEHPAVQKLAAAMNDSRKVCLTKPFGPEETFCNFDVCKPPEKRIDYIFTDKENFTVTKYAVFANIQNVRYPSDHYPVMINCKIKK